MSRRRAAEPAAADEDDVDESTVIGLRRSVAADPVAGDDDEDDVDESTVIAQRRAVVAEPVAADDDGESDEATVVTRRRSDVRQPPVEAHQVTDQDDDLDATQMGGRRAARLAAQQEAAAEELEPTDPGQRRAQAAPVDDVTAVSKRKTGLEATIKSLRKPKINPPAKIETLSLASRRTTQILDDGGQPVSREAFTPEEAILKAPYKPRKQTIIPVVHLDRQLDTRPPKPFAESMTALARQRAAARRRVMLMALVGGGTMVLSVGGIIALLMLG